MISRWSSKPKEQKAARIRENQRRHRAKTKAYIADLERQLAQERTRLDEVLRQNAALTSELERLRADRADQSVANQPVTNNLPKSIGEAPIMISPDAEAMAPPNSSASRNRSDPSSSPLPWLGKTTELRLPSAHLGSPAPPSVMQVSPTLARCEERASPAATRPRGDEQAHATPGSNACAATDCPARISSPTSSSLDDHDPLAVLQRDCPHLPLPRRGDSTIPCKAAYDMIKQQNVHDLDLRAVGESLRPGFRRAVVHGDGCTVDSKRVFSVLDAISSLPPSGL